MGWCISDSESSEIIELFLSRVKARSPNTDVKVIMTDDGMIDTHYCLISTLSSFFQITLDGLVPRQCMVTSNIFCVSGTWIGKPSDLYT